jgi:hypothetical protein
MHPKSAVSCHLALCSPLKNKGSVQSRVYSRLSTTVVARQLAVTRSYSVSLSSIDQAWPQFRVNHDK